MLRNKLARSAPRRFLAERPVKHACSSKVNGKALDGFGKADIKELMLGKAPFEVITPESQHANSAEGCSRRPLLHPARPGSRGSESYARNLN